MKSQPILPFLPTAPSGDRPGTAVPGNDPGFAKTLDRYRRMPGPSRPAGVELRRPVETHRAERRPELDRGREPEHQSEPKRAELTDRSGRREPADRNRRAERRDSTERVDDRELVAEATSEAAPQGKAEVTPVTTTEETQVVVGTGVEDSSADLELAVEAPGVSSAALLATGTEAVETAETTETTETAESAAVADIVTEGEGDELTVDLGAAADPNVGTELEVDTEAVHVEPEIATADLTETSWPASSDALDAATVAGGATHGPSADSGEPAPTSAAHDSPAPAVEAATADLTADGGQETTGGSPSTFPTSGERPIVAGPAVGSADSSAPTVVVPTVAPTPTASVAAPVAAAVPGSTTAAAATGTTAWEQVGTSIASAVRTLQDGSHRLLLRLYPEELGSVVLELTVSGERVDVRLVAQQVGTRDLLSQTAAELRQDLDQNGLSLGSMDIDLERGPESGSNDDEDADTGNSGLGFGGAASTRRSEPRLVAARRSDSSLDLDL